MTNVIQRIQKSGDPSGSARIVQEKLQLEKGAFKFKILLMTGQYFEPWKGSVKIIAVMMPQHGDFSQETEPGPSPDVTIPGQILTIQFQGEKSLSIFRRSMKIHIVIGKNGSDNENNKGLKTDP